MMERARASSPRQALALPRHLGREVENFVEPEWEAHRFDIVVRGNVAKFAQNAELRTYLLHTGEKVLVEASPVDLIWGAGVAAGRPSRGKPGPLARGEPSRLRPYESARNPS